MVLKDSGKPRHPPRDNASVNLVRTLTACWGRLLLALSLSLASGSVWAQPEAKVIRLNLSPGGLPPYTLVDKNRQAGGLMVELLRRAAAKAGYAVKAMEVPKNRVEAMMRQGELDATPRAREWTTTPEDFLFSEPILTVRDVVFSRKAEPLPYTEPASLAYKRVGTMLGFVYPVLEPSFTAKAVQRVDVSSEKSLLAMLRLDRLDAVVINELSALWIIKNEGWADDFVYAKTEVQSYQYRMMFSKAWQSFVPLFNRELATMKNDGSLERLIRQFMPDKTVAQH
jgi:polar amino acid transport system substrate-binding protein